MQLYKYKDLKGSETSLVCWGGKVYIFLMFKVIKIKRFIILLYYIIILTEEITNNESPILKDKCLFYYIVWEM